MAGFGLIFVQNLRRDSVVVMNYVLMGHALC
jgi:hypothetical protein